MLKVLFIALLFSAAVLAAPVCTSTCQKDAGLYCGSNTTSTGTATYTCGYGLYCNSTASVCNPSIAAGQPCSPYVAGECAAGTTCTLTTYPNYVCQNASTTVGPGHVCSADSDCLFNNQPGNCTSGGTCFGLEAGAACTLAQTGTAVCNAGLWCNGSVCLTQGLQDDDCAGGPYAFYQCAEPFSCVDGSCVAFSQDEDDDCTSLTQCIEGLYCTGTAAAAGTCEEPADASLNPCNVTTTATDCQTAEVCVCNVCQAPTVYPDGFGDAYIAYWACISNQTAACAAAVPVGCPQCFDAWCDYITISGAFSQGLEAACTYSPAQIALAMQCINAGTTATTGSATAASTGGSTNGVTAGTAATASTGATNGVTGGTVTAGATATSTNQATATNTNSGTATSAGKTTATATGSSSTSTSSASIVAASFFLFAVVFALLF